MCVPEQFKVLKIPSLLLVNTNNCIIKKKKKNCQIYYTFKYVHKCLYEWSESPVRLVSSHIHAGLVLKTIEREEIQHNTNAR